MVYHAGRMLATEMIHFVNQVQYYLLFEVSGSKDEGKIRRQRLCRRVGVASLNRKKKTRLALFSVLQVLESGWQSLTETLESAKNFDQVLQAHDVFLNSLLERMFLLPKSQVGGSRHREEGGGEKEKECR